MKKTLLYLILASGLVGCAKELNPATEETPVETPVTFEIKVLQTKAARTTWADGDAIYVFFKGLENKYLVLTYDGSGWTNAAGGDAFVDTDFSTLSDKALTAVHFPMAVDVAYANNKFSFTSDGKPVYNYYLFQTGVEYTVDGTTVKANLALGKPDDIVLFHVAGIEGSVDDYTFGCSLVRPVACASVSADGTVNEEVLQAGARLSGIADSDGAVFGGRLTKTGSADYTFTLASNDKIYTLNRTGKTLEAGKMYNFPSLSASDWSAQNASDLYVDLGLSVKWAKFNLGATKPEEYGDYFAWGETTGYNSGKTDFSWTTYFDTSDRGKSFEKYATDKKTLIELTDDAAYAALGGTSRIPTEAEWSELKMKCEWTWTDDYNGTGVAGRIVKGKNNNTIFLPAAGRRYNTTLYNVGSRAYYWSLSLNRNQSSSEYAMLCGFQANGWGMSSLSRCEGMSVRPVSE